MIHAESFQYSLLAFSSALFLVILIINDISFLNKNNRIHRAYFALIIWTILTCFEESIVGIFVSDVVNNNIFYFIIEFIFYFSTAVASGLWLYYTTVLSSFSNKTKNVIRSYGALSIVVQLILLILNIKLKNIYYIDEVGNYYDGKNVYLIFIIQYTVYLLSGIIGCIASYNPTEKNNRFILSLLVFFGLPLFFGILAYVFYGIPSYSLGNMFGCCIIHLFINGMNQQFRRTEMEAAKNQAEAANKAKSVFLFNMSHDIRTPLNAIVGYLDLIKKNIDDPEKIKIFLNKADISQKNLISLINNILEFARIENGKLNINYAPSDISNNIEFTKEIIKFDVAKKNLTLECSSEIYNPYVICDSIHAGEIVTNILTNAIKYTPNGGKIEFSLKQIPGPTAEDCYIIFQCKDSGIGMSQDFLEHAFDNFERERNSSNISGTGLGLGIVKKLVELMNGTVEIKSELGRGTTVTTKIPHKLCKKEDIVTEEKKVTFEQSLLRGKRTLLVEDNEFNREIAEILLSENGVNVETAENGLVAVEKLLEHRNDYYDFVLMDLQMPIMDGFEATKCIRKFSDEKLRQIPIIALTANAYAEDKQEVLKAGMDAHFAKPIDFKKLCELINEII